MRRRQPVYGYTKCPGCEKSLDDGRPVVAFTANVQVGARNFGAYCADVTLRWHEECKAEAEAFNERSRERAEADWAATVARIQAEIEAGSA